jgi:predicted transcriptional regulator
MSLLRSRLALSEDSEGILQLCNFYFGSFRGTQMAKRQHYDWELGDKLSRAGFLSIREIARQLGCSEAAVRKRIKQKGLRRDLSAMVRKEAGIDMVRAEVRGEVRALEASAYESTRIVVEVVRAHRQKLQRAKALFDKLAGQFEEAIVKMDEIEAEAIENIRKLDI